MRRMKAIRSRLSHRQSMWIIASVLMLILANLACGLEATGSEPADDSAMPGGDSDPVAVGDPEVLSEDQAIVLSDFGWPQTFHILAAYDSQDRVTRYETWHYHDGGIAYVFLDGEFLFEEEAEVYANELQATPYRPDAFVLGQSLEDVRANHPGVEWTRVDSLEGIGEGVELYVSEMIIVGFSENQLISVSALAFLPDEGGAQ
jgi:hypothetical protein